MNKYFELFLRKGITAGTLIGLLLALPIDRIGVFIAYGISIGLIFGFFTTLSAYNYDRKLLKRGILNPRNDAYQFRALVLKQPIDRLMEVCKDGALSLEKSKVDYEDLDQGHVSIKTGITYYYYGEIIDLFLKVVDPEMTLVEIRSYPKVLLPFVTHGKNLENIETIVGHIKERYEKDIIVGT